MIHPYYRQDYRKSSNIEMHVIGCLQEHPRYYPYENPDPS